MLVLDSGGLSRLARRTTDSAALIAALRARDLWPPAVPSVVLVEALTSRPGQDVNENRLLKACQLVEAVPVATARRAAALRSRAGRGSAVDAIVVAVAEPGRTVLSGDVGDLRALADHADGVSIERV
jgi:hypothetical protein